jgi:predicted GNAT family N-acyltransferase
VLRIQSLTAGTAHLRYKGGFESFFKGHKSSEGRFEIVEIRMQTGLPPDARTIRQAVFVDEQGFHDEFDALDETATHLVAYEDGRAVGCCRFYRDASGAYHVGRIAVVRSRRGEGLGAQMVAAVENVLKGRGVPALRLSAQVRVQPFYEKLGYAAKGEIYLDEFCEHITMEKAFL